MLRLSLDSFCSYYIIIIIFIVIIFLIIFIIIITIIILIIITTITIIIIIVMTISIMIILLLSSLFVLDSIINNIISNIILLWQPYASFFSILSARKWGPSVPILSRIIDSEGSDKLLGDCVVFGTLFKEMNLRSSVRFSFI